MVLDYRADNWVANFVVTDGMAEPMVSLMAIGLAS